MVLISPAVRAFPPMPQLPLLTSSTITQVTSRIFSPSIETIASVSLRIISCFCAVREHAFYEFDLNQRHDQLSASSQVVPDETWPNRSVDPSGQLRQ